ncbi:MAG: ABC transporter ATP-binding protein [Candidatus Heimdallarchaeaceae archaeon]
MNEKGKPIIEVEKLLHVYKGKVETIALPGISFKVFPGEKVAIRGKSGVGKTTLLHCLAGILKPTAGKIIVNGRNIVEFDEEELADYRTHTVGLIYQSFNLAPFLSVEDNIALPMIIAKKPKKERIKRVKELAETLGINRYLKTKPENLSGGEQQRVAIAVALANNPQIILADEPTGNLDEETSQIVYETLVHACKKHGTTLVLVSHDPASSKYVERELLLPKLKSQVLADLQ